MMSDQNTTGNGPVKPQVIDLDAEEIKTEPDAPRSSADEDLREQDTAPADQPPPARDGAPRRSALWIAVALVLGLIAGGWLYRDVLAGYFPSGEMTAMKARLDALEQTGTGLAGEIAALKTAAEGATQSAGAAGEEARAAAQQAQSALDGMGALDSRLGGLDQKIAAAETALAGATADLGQLRKSMSGAVAPASPGLPADTAALAALGQRIDALEKDVASLKSAAPQAASEDKASVTSTLSQALSDLKAKVAAGAPYPEEYDRIARMVPAAAGLETVGARAAEGLPNAEGLTAELRAAIPALPQPEAPPAEDNSYFGTLMKSLSGVVTIRAIGETDWPGVAARASAFAEAGDLQQAIGVIDAAEGEKPMALTQWRDRAAARLQLEQALAEVSEAVLRQIAALGGAAQ
jgi:hypothetical protein